MNVCDLLQDRIRRARSISREVDQFDYPCAGVANWDSATLPRKAKQAHAEHMPKAPNDSEDAGHANDY